MAASVTPIPMFPMSRNRTMTPFIAPSRPIPADATMNSPSLVRYVDLPRLRASGSLPPTAIRSRP